MRRCAASCQEHREGPTCRVRRGCSKARAFVAQPPARQAGCEAVDLTLSDEDEDEPGRQPPAKAAKLTAAGDPAGPCAAPAEQSSCSCCWSCAGSHGRLMAAGSPRRAAAAHAEPIQQQDPLFRASQVRNVAASHLHEA